MVVKKQQSFKKQLTVIPVIVPKLSKTATHSLPRRSNHATVDTNAMATKRAFQRGSFSLLLVKINMRPIIAAPIMLYKNGFVVKPA